MIDKSILKKQLNQHLGDSFFRFKKNFQESLGVDENYIFKIKDIAINTDENNNITITLKLYIPVNGDIIELEEDASIEVEVKELENIAYNLKQLLEEVDENEAFLYAKLNFLEQMSENEKIVFFPYTQKQ